MHTDLIRFSFLNKKIHVLVKHANNCTKVRKALSQGLYPLNTKACSPFEKWTKVNEPNTSVKAQYQIKALL